ncbi:MAG: DUF2336 domain-containing protein [Parasphingopyxis sp.]|uniref:DUF2336 domain-containing protein n=1 Tax=Parasphingopyxis sp. TaxID=1920299 RepID=UPI00261BDBA7|nr:DUF2336 domain-containing protein [uncultured Parasphingopyxis sp.]
MVDPVPPEQEMADEHALALLGAPARAMIAMPRRVALAIATLRSPEERPLSDIERLAADRSIERLFHAVEADLRARMLLHPDFPDGEELRQSFGSIRVAIAAKILSSAGLAIDAELVGAILRHIAIHRLGSMLERQEGGDEADLFEELIESEDPAVSRAATAMMIARNGERDMSGVPQFDEGDLSDAQRRMLYWRVAAALRDYAVGIHGADAAAMDRIAVSAVETVLSAPHGSPLVSAAIALAEGIDATDAMCVRCARAGHIWPYAAMLAKRANLSVETVADFLTGGDIAAHALVLAACGMRRESAAGILMLFAGLSGAHGGGDDALVDVMTGYDAIDAEAAREALKVWQSDALYRETVAALADPATRTRQ